MAFAAEVWSTVVSQYNLQRHRHVWRVWVYLGKQGDQMVFDSAAPEQEAYWQKSYVARLDRKGHFDVTITEPTRSRGTLRIVFCFENGVVTGDGRNHGISGAVEIPYAEAQRAAAGAIRKQAPAAPARCQRASEGAVRRRWNQVGRNVPHLEAIWLVFWIVAPAVEP